jgi:hypothetical protein
MHQMAPERCATAAALTALAAQFGNRLVASRAVRKQHATIQRAESGSPKRNDREFFHPFIGRPDAGKAPRFRQVTAPLYRCA